MTKYLRQAKNVVYGLYCTCHPGKGIRYCGKTVNSAGTRWSGHKHAATNKSNAHNKWDYHLPVHNWMRKHGVDNIEYVVLEVAPESYEIDALEVEWIYLLRERGLADLNLSTGGGGSSGWKHTDEAKQKMSARLYTQETRNKMSKSAKARGISEAAVNSARLRFGEKSALSISDDETVSMIKSELWNGNPPSHISEKYGYSRNFINHINNGRTWLHVPWPIGPRIKPSQLARSLKSSGRVQSESAKEMVRRKQEASWASGTRKGALTDNQVREIRLLRAEGLLYKEIASRVGCSQATVGRVLKNGAYSWVR